MVWQLVPETDDRQAVPIDKAILFFGRHPECDVVITSSRKVSRKHCCVAQVDHELVVRDLGSMNGIRVNGKTVRRQAPLRLGDVLTVGDVEFRIADGPVKRRPEPRRKPPASADDPQAKRDLSQDVPVVIPNEDGSFALEESMQRRRGKNHPRSSEAVELSKSDILDDDDERDSWFEVPTPD